MIGRPFTLQYAKESVAPELWSSPEFKRKNDLISMVWAGAFLVMVLAELAMLASPALPHRLPVFVIVVALHRGSSSSLAEQARSARPRLRAAVLERQGAMASSYQLIVGAGPAGLSAGARAGGSRRPRRASLQTPRYAPPPLLGRSASVRAAHARAARCARCRTRTHRRRATWVGSAPRGPASRRRRRLSVTNRRVSRISFPGLLLRAAGPDRGRFRTGVAGAAKPGGGRPRHEAARSRGGSGCPETVTFAARRGHRAAKRYDDVVGCDGAS